MEQKSAHDAAPLEPPTPDVAQAYLDEVGAVEQRREEHIDRRAVGWLSVVNAVVLSLFLYLTIVGLRDGATTVTQPVLFAMLIWGQLTTGLAARNGVQWQPTRRRWVMVFGVAVLCVVVVGSMFAAVFAADVLDCAVVYVAPLVTFVALTGIGVRQLWQARGPRPARRRPRPSLSPGMRMATVALGIILGGLTAIMSVPESALTAVLLLLLVLVIMAWMFAGLSSNLGLPTLVAQWGWPQFTAYGVSTFALFASAAWALFGAPATIPFAAIAGAAVMVLFVLAATLGGRDAD